MSTKPTNPPALALPPEIVEAIARTLYDQDYDSLDGFDLTEMDDLCAALAPHWPRPAPVTADARKETCGELRALLRKRSAGQCETWGFVAAFMQMIDEVERGGAQ